MTNNISDITPLSNLTSLTSLSLNDNNISDVSPLVNNVGLGSGDTVYLEENHLNAVSVSTHVPALRARGTSISRSQFIHIRSLKASDSSLTAGQSFIAGDDRE